MIRLDDQKAVQFCDGLRRRDFLHAGSLGLMGLGLADLLGLMARGAARPTDMNVILLFLVGGPSQLDTWDMKPGAPSTIRGPYRPVETNIPGIEISEVFPRLARHADKFAILRTLHHDAAAVHDTGHQLMQTGRLFRNGIEHPHMGCVLTKLRGGESGLPAHVVLPHPIGATGGNMPHGHSAGYLGKEYDPFVPPAAPLGAEPESRGLQGYFASHRAGSGHNWRELIDGSVRQIEAAGDARLAHEDFHRAYTVMTSTKAREAFDLRRVPEHVRARYGHNRFGQSCLLARRLVEAGVRFVTVNMFETVFDEITWDIHGAAPFSPIECYSNQVGPMFDNAFSSLLEDLSASGMLHNTMLVATGEFGRTPRINPIGGRDHWPGCWSMLMAGGPIRGGQVVGESDETASAPRNRPITPAEVAATIYHGLGIDLDARLPGPDRMPIRIVDEGVEPVRELLA